MTNINKIIVGCILLSNIDVSTSMARLTHNGAMVQKMALVPYSFPDDCGDLIKHKVMC